MAAAANEHLKKDNKKTVEHEEDRTQKIAKGREGGGDLDRARRRRPETKEPRKKRKPGQGEDIDFWVALCCLANDC